MHTIRLHGPWTAEIGEGPECISRRVHLPREWSQVIADARAKTIVLQRRFHRPTGLTEATRVWLAVPSGWPVGRVTLNAQAIEPIESDSLLRFDLSDLVRLRDAHELTIELRAGDLLRETTYRVEFQIEE